MKNKINIRLWGVLSVIALIFGSILYISLTWKNTCYTGTLLNLSRVSALDELGSDSGKKDFSIDTPDGLKSYNRTYGFNLIVNGEPKNLSDMNSEPYDTLIEKHKFKANYTKSLISSTLSITADKDISFFLDNNFISIDNYRSDIQSDGTVKTVVNLKSSYMDKILNNDMYIFVPDQFMPKDKNHETYPYISTMKDMYIASKNDSMYFIPKENISFSEEAKNQFMSADNISAELTVHKTSSNTACISYAAKSIAVNDNIKGLLNYKNTLTYIFVTTSVK